MDLLRVTLVIFSSTLLLIFSAQNQAQVKVWKVTSLNWQPYSGADMPNGGGAVQYLTSVLKHHNIELIVEYYPWKRAQKLAKDKAYIGYFPAWPDEIRQGFIASKSIMTSQIGFVKKKLTKL